MLQCPPDCPHLRTVMPHIDSMSLRKSSFLCKNYNKSVFFLDKTNDLQRLDTCDLSFKKIVAYVCYFTFGTRELKVSSIALDKLKDGFWINDDFKFTMGSDSLIWIPPSKIHYIKKVESEVLDEE